MEEAAVALDSLDARMRELDAGPAALGHQIREKRLLGVDVRPELEVAGGRHARGIFVDGLAPGEVDHRREGCGSLEDSKGQTRLLRRDRRGEARNAAADDREVERLSRRAVAKVRLLENRPHRARSRVLTA